MIRKKIFPHPINLERSLNYLTMDWKSMSIKDIKETDEYKAIPREYIKSKMKKVELVELLSSNPSSSKKRVTTSKSAAPASKKKVVSKNITSEVERRTWKPEYEFDDAHGDTSVCDWCGYLVNCAGADYEHSVYDCADCKRSFCTSCSEKIEDDDEHVEDEKCPHCIGGEEVPISQSMLLRLALEKLDITEEQFRKEF